MKTRLASLLVLTLASTLAACSSTVVGGGSSGPDDCFENCDETTTSGSDPDAGQGGAGGSGGSDPGPQAAVAMTRAQSDALWEEYWENNDPSGSTSSTGGGGLDPNDLFIQLSNLGASCGSPFVELPCGGNWSATLVLPPALQQVGVYDLSSPELVMYSSMTETGAPYSPTPGDCSWGGGSTGPGTLEILSITATEVQFQLEMDSLWEANPNGVYTAPRCP
jgi:hypothetical protein